MAQHLPGPVRMTHEVEHFFRVQPQRQARAVADARFALAAAGGVDGQHQGAIAAAAAQFTMSALALRSFKR